MTEEKTSNGARRAGAQDPASANAPVASRSAVGKPRVRRARTGDVAPASTAKGIGAYVASEATGSAQDAKQRIAGIQTGNSEPVRPRYCTLQTSRYR